MPRFSIRALLIIAAGVIAAVPALVVVVGAGLYIRDYLYENTLLRGQWSAQELALIYGGYLDKHVQALDTLSDALATSGIADVAVDQQALTRVKSNYAGFASSVILADLSGRVIAAAASEADRAADLNVGDRDWFKTTIETRKPFVDRKVLRSRLTGRLIVPLAAPVLDAGGRVIAVVSGGLDLGEIGRLAKRPVGKDGAGHAGVATAEGLLLAYPRNELVDAGQTVTGQGFWPQANDNATGTIPTFIGLEGKPLIGGFATVPSTGWKVWVVEPATTADDVLYKAYARASLIGAIGAGGGLLLAFFGAGALARPIERLRGTANAIAAGDLDQKAGDQGPREISDLGRAINAMSLSLRERIASEQDTQQELRQAVSDYSDVARRIVQGDLSARAPVSDHPELSLLATSLNGMTESMARLVSEIREATANLSSASSEILVATSQQVSATAEEAVAVKQTASSVIEVKQTSTLAMQKAGAVAQAAQRASDVAETGRSTVEATIAGSQEARQRMETVAQRILGFIEQAEAIAEINTTVGDLAEQSNLLAVNASIEAAKAGEFGRGFAVVASEIKTLADQSKQATAQVRRILVDIQKASQAAMLAAEQGVKAAEVGSVRAAESGNTIGVLADSITEAARAGQQIAAASQEQSAGMDQIAAAMRNIEQSTSQTVAATRQVERSARDLNDLASRLSALVAFASSREPPQ
ncbi:methyl-accepting chemotaxis protein [Ancylobacter sp. MQZ15Z-1]|uniref:Methyl-accepting chemotaxis protein n=1 Tax=Ancylobacter mangrovi TaxID=2972472 RepID=A0A9X2T6E9_9HYPH|nr:methyl-accepting chemotaxis protein [Ancylobacter mangrovi]MCS0494873.1 methyl-accepting chemotaxis protein [Ancylobacter mangrovi]